MQGTIQITLDTLLNGDRTLLQLCPGDETTPAQISVAEVKELMVAVNVSNERIQLLYQDMLKAEARIGKLERQMLAIKGAQE